VDDVTLYTGDCAQVMREYIPDGSIDLTVTSPPYDNLRTYKGYTFDFEAIAAQLWRVTKPGGVVVWVVADATINGSETGTSFRQALYFMGLGFNLHDTMIYETDKPPMNDNRYQACFEFMFVLSKGHLRTWNPLMIRSIHAGKQNTSRVYLNSDGTLKPMTKPGVYNAQKVRTAIWRYSSGNDKPGHPAPFPEALARDHIASWSNPGDVVLDPMMGSGTTGKEAVKAGRRFIGIDIAAEYVALARERIGRTQLQPLLITPPSNQSMKLTQTEAFRFEDVSTDAALLDLEVES
jgi:DNA modification methylase